MLEVNYAAAAEGGALPIPIRFTLTKKQGEVANEW